MNDFERIGLNVTVWPGAKIVGKEAIAIGSNVIIDDFTFIMGGKKTVIGDYVHIGSFTSITGGGELEMGDFSGLSSGVRIYTGNEDYKGGSLTNPTVPAPFRIPVRSFVRIGKHAIVGANAVIMPGVTIGEGAAIGACALVRNNCEPWTIYAGVPARPIGVRKREMIEQLEKELRAKSVMVSVCCLAYNQEGLIRKSLDGFLMQKTDFPFEILIHDDASTDGTTEILREYERRHCGIVKLIVQQENQYSRTGIYPVFNLYRVARGKYIAECDGDDYWTDPLKLQKQVDFLEKNTDYVMCHHDYLILEGGKARKPHADPPMDFSSIDLIRYSLQGHGIGLCTRMFRNRYSEETAKDIETMSGDYPTNVYMGTIGKCKYIPGIQPSIYRRNNGSNSWCSLPAAEIERRTKAMHRKIYDWFLTRGDLAHIEMRRAFL